MSEIDVGVEMLGGTDLYDFMEDEKLKRALCMTVINVGELIKNITPETRKKYPEIPWREITGMRDMARINIRLLEWKMIFKR